MTATFTAEPSNKFTIGAAKPQGTGVALKVTVPGPGTLAASGKDLKKTKASPRGAGTLSLKLKLSGAGQKALKRHHKIKVKVKVTFTPSGGKAKTRHQGRDLQGEAQGALAPVLLGTADRRGHQHQITAPLWGSYLLSWKTEGSAWDSQAHLSQTAFRASSQPGKLGSNLASRTFRARTPIWIDISDRK